VTIMGTASDNISVAKVEVSVDGGAWRLASGTTSWSASVDTTTLSDATHTITSRATDTKGNAASTSVSVTADNTPAVSPPVPDTTPPSIVASSPGAGTTVAGTITVTGTASDDVGLARVEVAVDSGAFQAASGAASWSFPLDTTGLANGPHSITARATDTSGNVASAGVTVTANNPVPDTTAPTVVISSPGTGATVGGTITVTGTASDNAGLAQVKVAVDGGAFQAASGAANWTFSMSTATFGDGSHTITARATDTSGLMSSASVGVTFANASSTHMVTPEGVTIDISSACSATVTTSQVDALLRANALNLAKIGPSLKVNVQALYGSQASTGASGSGGVYTSFNAIIGLDCRTGSTFRTYPDATVGHEYGHVWTLYWRYMGHGGDWTDYLIARGLYGDPRLGTSGDTSWDVDEIAADDYRLLFGTDLAISERPRHKNTYITDPRNVPGLRDFFLNTWATAG